MKKKPLQRVTDHDSILEPPVDFRFQPACGEILANGDVVVSGMNFKQAEIHQVGGSFKTLCDIFQDIAEDMKKKK